MNYKSLTKTDLDNWFSEIKFKTKPYQHQLASIAFTLGENRSNVMFIHDIGVGKTLTALYLLQCWNITGKTLVICPKSVFKTWKDEIEKHTDFSYIVLKGSRENRWQSLITNHADIWIINYEGLKLIGADRKRFGKKSKHVPNEAYSKSLGFECVIIDESHHLRDSESTQTQITYHLSKWSRYSILMTGTPIGRAITDMFGQFLVLDSGRTFGTNYFYFLKHYFFKYSRFDFKWTPKRVCQICGELYTKKHEHLITHNIDFEQYRKKYGREETSEDVILKIVNENSIRYSREECQDLPQRVYEIREVDLTSEQRKMTDKIIAGLDIKELKGKKINYHLQKVIQVANGFLLKENNVIYDFLPNPKLDEFEKLIEELDEKFIVYHQFVYEAELLSSKLKAKNINHEIINGTVKNKEEHLNRFIKDDNCRGLVAHPKTCGEGINIQCASITIFYDNGFIGTVLRSQAEGRTFRTGQKKSCVFIDIIARNSIDEILYNSLKNKIDYTKSVLDYLQDYKK